MYNTIPTKLNSFVPEAATPHDALAFIKRSGQFPTWQYNGVAEFGIVLEWCEEHFGDDYIWNWETIYFKSEKEQLAFVLRWS